MRPCRFPWRGWGWTSISVTEVKGLWRRVFGPPVPRMLSRGAGRHVLPREDPWNPPGLAAGGVPRPSLRLSSHRRSPVGDGRPSACHGFAVACIGQPPPPSAPGPVLGWLARPLSRGCGGRAAASRRVVGVRPKISSRDCAGVGRFGANLAALVIKQIGPLGVAGFWADRLPRSDSTAP